MSWAREICSVKRGSMNRKFHEKALSVAASSAGPRPSQAAMTSTTSNSVRPTVR